MIEATTNFTIPVTKTKEQDFGLSTSISNPTSSPEASDSEKSSLDSSEFVDLDKLGEQLDRLLSLGPELDLKSLDELSASLDVKPKPAINISDYTKSRFFFLPGGDYTGKEEYETKYNRVVECLNYFCDRHFNGYFGDSTKCPKFRKTVPSFWNEPLPFDKVVYDYFYSNNVEPSPLVAAVVNNDPKVTYNSQLSLYWNQAQMTTKDNTPFQNFFINAYSNSEYGVTLNKLGGRYTYFPRTTLPCYGPLSGETNGAYYLSKFIPRDYMDKVFRNAWKCSTGRIECYMLTVKIPEQFTLDGRPGVILVPLPVGQSVKETLTRVAGEIGKDDLALRARREGEKKKNKK